MTEREEIVQKTKKTLEHISYTYSFIDAYKSINNARIEHNEEINYAPGFFSIVSISLIRSMFIEISKLIDKHKDAFSIYALIKLVKSNLEVFSMTNNKDFKIDDEIACLDEGLNKLDSIVKSIRTQRDKIYAHLDKNLFLDYSQILMDSPVSIIKITELLEYMTDFCNSILSALINEIIEPVYLNNDDLEELLKRVKWNYSLGQTYAFDKKSER